MLTYVYRMQDSEGRGPYRGVDYRALWAAHNNHHDGEWGTGKNARYDRFDAHLSPNEEWGAQWMNHVADGAQFGFKSLTQAQNWFIPSELKRLNELGYSLVRERGSIVLTSPRQVLYIPAPLEK